jgi:cell division protein FtsL
MPKQTFNDLSKPNIILEMSNSYTNLEANNSKLSEMSKKKIGSFSLIERVILSAGAMLIFSVSFLHSSISIEHYVILSVGGLPN